MSTRIETRALGVNQIDAASDTYAALLQIPSVQEDPSLIAVKETDIYRLRRGLCLPSASATCINATLGERLIGGSHDEAQLTVGDVFRLLLPYHNRKDLVNTDGETYQNPWFVVGSEGDMYHQAIIAFANGLGVHAKSLTQFSNVESFQEFLEEGGKIALSLDNSFVLEQTLQNNPSHVRKRGLDSFISIEGPDGITFSKFEDGRHVISVLGLDDDGSFLIHDSFRLPQMDGDHEFMRLPADKLNPYLVYRSGGAARGIAFSRDAETLEAVVFCENKQVFVPEAVVAHVARMRSRE